MDSNELRDLIDTRQYSQMERRISAIYNALQAIQPLIDDLSPSTTRQWPVISQARNPGCNISLAGLLAAAIVGALVGFFGGAAVEIITGAMVGDIVWAAIGGAFGATAIFALKP